ncbi:hypothetical protein [Enterocloster bolteae]|uniref:hypothetical protein n=1 Tax=Enterocloster bolteae TaxID=208479 RepID=UPI0018A0706E|nr:hypothetical protein [Enterocloster bolteae]
MDLWGLDECTGAGGNGHIGARWDALGMLRMDGAGTDWVKPVRVLRGEMGTDSSGPDKGARAG